MPTPWLGEPCVPCPVVTFCHVQTQSSNGWENTLPGLLPSFQSKGLTRIVRMHLGARRDHTEGWFLQQAPAEIASFSSYGPRSFILQLATPSEQPGYSAELKHTPPSAAAASHILQQFGGPGFNAESWTCRWRKYGKDKHIKNWTRNPYPKEGKMREDRFPLQTRLEGEP